MNIFIMSRNVKTYLDSNNDDVVKVMNIIHKNYVRGVFTEEEYLTMADILAGYKLTGVI